MINSVSMGNYTNLGVKPATTKIQNPISSSIVGSSILPTNDKHIIIDGKRFDVQTVPDNTPWLFSFREMTKEVVVVDGKQYDVQTVSDPIACDKTKEVVVIDGKQYDVRSSNGFFI